MKFTHQNRYYRLQLYSAQSVELESFDPIKIIDKTQIHRIMLGNTETARLLALRFVGDVYTFNNIQVISMPYKQYLIRDLENKIEILFSLGAYDNIIIHSGINFGDKEFNLLDKLASAISVKYLLITLTGKLPEQSDIPSRLSIDNLHLIIIQVEGADKELVKRLYQYDSGRYKGNLKSSITADEEERLREIFSAIDFDITRKFEFSERKQAYDEFLAQLKTKPDDEVLDFLKKYVDYNFLVIPSRDVNTEWIHPYNLFYEKKGDYKSIALFYYFTLNSLNFRVRSYFVIPLEKKDDDTVAAERRLSVEDKERLKIRYKQVQDIHNINVLLYEPPAVSDAIYLVTVNIDGFWHYTAGTHWVDAGIRDSGRVCSNYIGGGCYYSFIRGEKKVENNEGFRESELTWDVFYDVE